MVKKCIAEIHFVKKTTFSRYSWYKFIPEDGRKDIEDQTQLGIIVSRRDPNRYICTMSDNVTDDEVKILMDNLMSLLKNPETNNGLRMIVRNANHGSLTVDQIDYIFRRLKNGLSNITLQVL